MVFINACRSAGRSPSCNQLDGWARKFLEAGAGDPTSIKNAIELSFGVAAGGSISLGIDGERKGEITHAMRLTIAGPGTPAP